MTATIEQLQKIVNDTTKDEQERKQAAEHILKLQQKPETEEERSRRRIRRAYGHLLGIVYQPTEVDLAEIEQEREQDQRQAQLRAIAGDEGKPMAERIQAAEQWRANGPEGGHWTQFNGADLVERLTPNPHNERMETLAANSRNESISVKQRFAALDEYRRLRDQFPKRDDPEHGLWLLDHGYDDHYGRELAAKVGKAVSAKRGASSSYVAETVRQNRGAEYDCPLADVGADWR